MPHLQFANGDIERILSRTKIFVACELRTMLPISIIESVLTRQKVTAVDISSVRIGGVAYVQVDFG
jgi:hypothetical protein